MHKRFLIFFVKIFYVLINSKFKGVEAVELCQTFDQYDQLTSSFYCLEYCCGTCNFNYCCSNKSHAVDSVLCRNQTVTNKPATEEHDNKQVDDSNEFQLKLYVEACGAFNNAFGALLQPKRCPENQKFCCGTCENRYCCNSSSDHLNQLECKLIARPTNESKQVNSYSYIFVILILGLILLLAFLCVPFMIFINKRSKKQERNILQFQNLTPVNPAQAELVIQEPVNRSPKKVDFNLQNAPPPAYSSLDFNQP